MLAIELAFVVRQTKFWGARAGGLTVLRSFEAFEL